MINSTPDCSRNHDATRRKISRNWWESVGPPSRIVKSRSSENGRSAACVAPSSAPGLSKRQRDEIIVPARRSRGELAGHRGCDRLGERIAAAEVRDEHSQEGAGVVGKLTPARCGVKLSSAAADELQAAQPVVQRFEHGEVGLAVGVARTALRSTSLASGRLLLVRPLSPARTSPSGLHRYRFLPRAAISRVQSPPRCRARRHRPNDCRAPVGPPAAGCRTAASQGQACRPPLARDCSASANPADCDRQRDAGAG